MLLRLRRDYAGLVTSGSQLTLLLIAARIDSRTGWIISLMLVALLSILAWLSALRRGRAISDTPTSKVASAAQGYVELQGLGVALDGGPLINPLSGLPCLWYRYEVERRENNKWVRHEAGESDASFLLDDGSGRCLVDPEHAEVLTRRAERWQQGEYRYRQWLLIERDHIYVLGQFATLTGADLELDEKEDVKLLLAEWKRTPDALHARFDLDGNRELSLREWALARAQARREVAAAHAQAHAHAELHTMRPPDDGRLYLISDLDPQGLGRRYRLWSALHLAFFFGALGAISWLAQFG